MARPKLLDAALTDQLAVLIGMGVRPTHAAVVAGTSARSLRRWRSAGRAELEQLSVEARLELALRDAEQAERAISWEATAARLREADDDLDGVLGPFAPT
jgi:hypothetical protein